MFEDELEQENQNLSKKNESLSSEVERIKEEFKAYKVLILKEAKVFFLIAIDQNREDNTTNGKTNREAAKRKE